MFTPQMESDLDGRPIVGDFLKMMFVEHRVVPTILVSDSCNVRRDLLTKPTAGFLLSVPLEQLPSQRGL